MASSSTINANIIHTSISSTTTTSVVGGDMIHNNARGGGSRMVSSSPWTQIVRGDSNADAAPVATEVIAAVSITPAVAAVTPSPSSPSTAAMGREVSVAASEQPMVVASSSGSDSWMVAAEEEGSDNGNGCSSGNAGKRPVWNKPSNGALEAGAVMGASWPALSESARVPSKGSLSDGSSPSSSSLSVNVPQISGSASSSSQKQVSHNANPNSTAPNHTMPARQRSMKRNSGANTSSSSNGGVSQPPAQQPQTGEMHLNNPSPRDHAVQRNSQSRGANDHSQQQQQQQRNSFRRNGGPHVRDGSHHHNYRRDQDREWNNHRNFNARDTHMQPQRGIPRFMRHPPPPPPLPPTTTTAFLGSPAMQAFGGPFGFHASSVYYVAGTPPDPLRTLSFVAAPVPPMYFPVPDVQLQSKIKDQIEYYFSNANLIRDTFLRQKMDDQGWVPIALIAGFNKVMDLTNGNIHLILEAIRNSSIVEVQVQGDKIRRRNDWMRWIMPPVQFPGVSGPPSVGRSSQDMLAAHVQSISLEENTTSDSGGRRQVDVPNEAFLGSSSGDFSSQSKIPSTDGAGQVSIQGGSDSSTLTRTPSK